MSQYAYIAVGPSGAETRGTLEVNDLSEALNRLRQMGLFPTKVFESARHGWIVAPRSHLLRERAQWLRLPIWEKVKAARLGIFTRQLATLVEAGMPLLRSLQVLEEQEENGALRRVIGQVVRSIEGGSSLGEALGAHPKVFNGLYISMVKAGEIGGALETTLSRLAEFIEKTRKLKGKVKAALFYPCAVMMVAAGVLGVLMGFVVPRFKLVFDGLLGGAPLPAFTRLIFGLSEGVVHHWVALAGALALAVCAAWGILRARAARFWLDSLKLSLPLLGPLLRKVAISRFAGTLGTLVSNGVPILQALTIVKDTAGNLVIGSVLTAVRENVKRGEPLAPTLKFSGVFPSMVAGMVDVGEQTGALPEMLSKIAETYDAEVDNAATALTSILEPVMIVFLAAVVGSIVVAMYLPIIKVAEGVDLQMGTRDAE